MAKKILIVDDNPNMSSLLSEMLEVFDHMSVRAADGTQALTELHKGGISMVITDMRMPNMTGLELLQQVKSLYPAIPVVLISGYSVAEIESQAGHLKADGFLGKPLLMSDIEQLLHRLL
ncbi:MAG: response regulator [candidate division Zixibacteria bacterium]|nr:response regulator [candidate division Zixibacteria bacterium]